jgi:hypothetical protein
MKLHEVFPSAYLKAADVGSDIMPVKIRRVVIEELGPDRERKAVAYFDGETRGLVLNKTNSRMIAAICHSDETDNWIGHTIALYTEDVSFQGRTSPAIRVCQPRANEALQTKAKSAIVSVGSIENDQIPF